MNEARDASAPPAVGPGRVVLLGFMGSGKSTVGRSLARRLRWDFLDFDVEIERRAGATIREIVDEHGEARLRELEARLTAEAADAMRLVLAPGGGWIVRPELLHTLGADTFAVWLQVSPEETVRRLRDDEIERPLRDAPDAVAQVAALLAEREPLYRLADLMVPTDGRSVEEIAFEIETVIRLRGV